MAAIVGCGDTVDPNPVGGGEPAAISVSTPADTLTFIGATAQLAATITDTEGKVVTGLTVTWRSRDADVLTVDVAGIVTTTGTGTAFVIGEIGELADSVALTVIQLPAFFTIFPAGGRRFDAIGEQRQFSATITDQGGVEIPGLTLTWSTEDTDVITVTPGGLAEAVGNGVADITLDIEGDTGAFPVTVAAPVTFVHANVVPMSQEIVQMDYDVVTENGVITAVGPSGSVLVPSGAFEVDATGLYLMPGLADMHIHFTCTTGFGCRNDLFLYLANGVTTARGMWGSPFQLKVREEIATGDGLGPMLYVASPGMDGPGGSFSSFTPLITSVAQARSTVQQHADAGYDYIKVYNTLTDAMYGAIHEEATARGIKVLGHKPFSVAFTRLTTLGHWTSEHLLDYEQEASPSGSIWSSEPNLGMVRSLAAQAAAAGVASTPTTAAFISITSEVGTYQSSNEARYTSPGVIAFSTNTLPAWPFTAAQRADRLRRQRDIIAILHDEGVPLLLGTDAGVRWIFPGFSIHTELSEMVAAGLTPYEALVTGTLNAATYLEAEGTFGVVGTGIRADLILLEANPLDDVANVARRVGVMAQGVWMPEATLQERLEEIATAYGR